MLGSTFKSVIPFQFVFSKGKVSSPKIDFSSDQTVGIKVKVSQESLEFRLTSAINKP